MNKQISVKDIEGVWSGDAITGLMQHCKDAWEIPLIELEDIMVVTFLNQKIALSHMILEAERRLKDEKPDDSELYDDQLKEAYERAKNT